MYKIIILLAAALTAFGQRGPNRAGAPPPPVPDAERGSVRGTVVGPGNEPLRKAEVTLRGGRDSGSSMVQTTDASGSFAFEGVAPGGYTLSVQRNGYVRTEYGARPGTRASGASLTVAPRQVLSGITVPLLPQAVLAGKVTDEDGDPVLRAAVQILRERWINGRRQLTPMSADSTNDLGEYRLSGLAPGKYYLMASVPRAARDPGVRARAETGEPNYAPVYYPGVNEITQATPMTLAAGQQMLGVDLQLRKVPMYRIRGKVIDESGRPGMNAAVMAVPVDGFAGVRSMGMVRNTEGTFEIPDVMPGSYTLVVNRMSREDRTRATGQISVQVGTRDLENVVLQLSKPFEITGQIRVPADAALPANMRVALESLQPGAPFSGGTQSETKPNASFYITGVSPGKYRFVVQNLPEGFYVKSVNVQGHDITAGAVINAAATGVELTLGANAPEISGAVLDADKQPVPGARVVLVPESSKSDAYWLFRNGTTDQNGGFALRGIPPGNYTVYAFSDIEEGSWHSPEFLASYQGKGVGVRLAEGTKEGLQLTVAR